MLLHYLVKYNNSKLTQITQKYNKMSSYLSLTQLETLPVQQVFMVSSPRNPQNDRLYVPAGIKKKQVAAERQLLRTRTTFSRSVMVSVGVSKLGFTDLIFVGPGVKVNGSYYRDVLLLQKLLPVMREVSGEFFIFQQDSAPAPEPAILSDFWSRQCQRSFPQICGLRTAPT